MLPPSELRNLWSEWNLNTEEDYAIFSDWLEEIGENELAKTVRMYGVFSCGMLKTSIPPPMNRSFKLLFIAVLFAYGVFILTTVTTFTNRTSPYDSHPTPPIDEPKIILTKALGDK